MRVDADSPFLSVPITGFMSSEFSGPTCFLKLYDMLVESSPFSLLFSFFFFSACFPSLTTKNYKVIIE
jgi:hypothetical protein